MGRAARGTELRGCRAGSGGGWTDTAGKHRVRDTQLSRVPRLYRPTGLWTLMRGNGNPGATMCYPEQ